MNAFFVGGIGTDVGKSFVTARLLSYCGSAGLRATSFKLVQTGCDVPLSADIVVHRQLSGQAITSEDRAGLSCGAFFPYPASPHLAAALAASQIQPEALWSRFQDYAAQTAADIVLCEGAGGMFVPIREDYVMLDWARDYQMPVILVCHAALGSIHQSLATLWAMQAADYLPVMLIYNPYPTDDAVIVSDSAHFLRGYVATHFPSLVFAQLAEAEKIVSVLCSMRA